MNEIQFYDILIAIWFGLSALVFVLLFFISAPYGRFARAGWGPRMSSRLGWFLMELPAVLVFGLFFLLGQGQTEMIPLILLSLWMVHYIHRAFIFPFRIRGERKQTTLLTVGLAIIFNLGNGYLNSRYIYSLGPAYPDSWLYDLRFIAGVLLFCLGFAINKHSDWILLRLRNPGETGYKIPRGGLYRFISCPNYFGEIVQWGGWALAAWNLGALAFFVWTVANLAPRAVSNHRWYHSEFEEYPDRRRALIPFVL